jgi:hypothetical protein
LDTREVLGTTSLAGPNGTRITPRTSRAILSRWLRGFEIGEHMTHWSICHLRPKDRCAVIRSLSKILDWHK